MTSKEIFDFVVNVASDEISTVQTRYARWLYRYAGDSVHGTLIAASNPFEGAITVGDEGISYQTPLKGTLIGNNTQIELTLNRDTYYPKWWLTETVSTESGETRDVVTPLMFDSLLHSQEEWATMIIPSNGWSFNKLVESDYVAALLKHCLIAVRRT